jgi:predicted GTPase
MAGRLRCMILGAAGRDFHDFQMFFRDRAEFQVMAFTAAQIPFIESRVFPKELAGPLYNDDIPIYSEDELPALIGNLGIDFVFLAYSDLAHEEVMHKASLVQACGAGFGLLGPHLTQLQSRLPVVSVTGVRTGVGKSPISQALARDQTARGRRVAVLRHPMPYGDLRKQRVLHYASEADLELHGCTIEEREEYTPYLEKGIAVFAGVDYRAILAEAEKEAEIILWDGGNNDYPFIRPDLSIVVLDALRPGHETQYFPGETNLRSANVLVLNKTSCATSEALALIRKHAAQLNPKAKILLADLVVSLESPSSLSEKRVLVVEDGPTLTHGGMAFGAGTVAARAAGAEIIDPHQFAVGTIADAYRKYPQIGAVVPALGYSDAQRRELEETISRTKADLVIDASPARLDRALRIEIPVVRVRYRFEQTFGPSIFGLVEDLIQTHVRLMSESS